MKNETVTKDEVELTKRFLTAGEYQRQADNTNLTEEGYEKVQGRVSDLEFVKLAHAGMGLVTEAGEFTDMLKKHAIYGKALDRVNLAEELGDLMWYVALACNTLGISMEDVMAKNIAKLKIRFPEKFTEAHALERDLSAERQVLEGSA